MRPARERILTGSAETDTDPDTVYRALVEPAEQMKWNTLYLNATVSPTGPIRDGSVMTGTFEGTGPATVQFQDVEPGRAFTHFSKMIVRGIGLGSFHHRYEVELASDKTLVRQTIRYQPSGFGRIVAPVIVRSFRQRLPISFVELQTHLDSL